MNKGILTLSDNSKVEVLFSDTNSLRGTIKDLGISESDIIFLEVINKGRK